LHRSGTPTQLVEEYFDAASYEPGKGFQISGKRWAAEARARIESFTKEELEKNGETKEMAEKWRDLYKDEIARNPNTPSVAGRADLMQHAADLLDGK
jgi:hypothetical protein